MPPADLYVLTGAPGSGKTAILDNVGPDIRRVAEPAREILEEQRSVGGAGTPDRDPSLFVDLLLQRSIDIHEAAKRWEGSVLFDRGVPDCIAYATLVGTDPTPSVLASEVYRYHTEVLVLEPWEEIYVGVMKRGRCRSPKPWNSRRRSRMRTNGPAMTSSRCPESR